MWRGGSGRRGRGGRRGRRLSPHVHVELVVGLELCRLAILPFPTRLRGCRVGHAVALGVPVTARFAFGDAQWLDADAVNVGSAVAGVTIPAGDFGVWVVPEIHVELIIGLELCRHAVLALPTQLLRLRVSHALALTIIITSRLTCRNVRGMHTVLVDGLRRQRTMYTPGEKTGKSDN